MARLRCKTKGAERGNIWSHAIFFFMQPADVGLSSKKDRVGKSALGK
jgi:hypothetical protein